jgi:Patatin-like phospholipase
MRNSRAIALSLFVCVLFISLQARAESPASKPNLCSHGRDRALVLSGGGAKGAFEAGAIYHLVVHRGCDFRDIAGVSVGALNGAFLAQAPESGNSLANLASQAEDLVTFWRQITTNQVTRPRVLDSDVASEAFFFLFGYDSLSETTGLTNIVNKVINPATIVSSDRRLRVGVTSFYDNSYHEFSPGDDDIPTGLFDQYILASSAVPVDVPLPMMETKTSKGPVNLQYADGGVSHQIPIIGYFTPCDFQAYELSLGNTSSPGSNLTVKRTSVPILSPTNGASNDSVSALCVQPAVKPHQTPIRELFVVLANPYSPTLPDTVQAVPTPIPTPVPGGQTLLEHTIDNLTETSFRADMNFAITANAMLSWRANLYRLVGAPALINSFPVSSANWTPPNGFPQPYKMITISPPKEYSDTYGFEPDMIQTQLYKGCIWANYQMTQQGLSSLASECISHFPRPSGYCNEDKDDPDPPGTPPTTEGCNTPAPLDH